jgi:hypothetical protein
VTLSYETSEQLEAPPSTVLKNKEEMTRPEAILIF